MRKEDPLVVEPKAEADMSVEERVQWLRDRGIEISTPEERRVGRVADAIRHVPLSAGSDLDHEKDNEDHQTNNVESDRIDLVRIPADTSRPLEQISFSKRMILHGTPPPSNAPLTFDLTGGGGGGDPIVQYLKQQPSPFNESSSEDIDVSLLSSQVTTLSNETVNVSDETLRTVAAEVNIETFSLVHAVPSNQYIGVNIYLDEVGMLKRLPLNRRATDYAVRAGFDPPPQFYGDVYLGRVHQPPYGTGGSVAHSFMVGPDTTFDAGWLRQATTDNLEYQMEINRITGRNDIQAAVAGTEGKPKEEDQGQVLWTQTEDELEVIVLVPTREKKDVTVQFRVQSVQVLCKRVVVTSIVLFEKVDIDSCTWTLEHAPTAVTTTSAEEQENASSSTTTIKPKGKLILSLEKVEPALWPRLRD